MATRNARARRPLHGVLLLDKPAGLSSNQALQRARWLLQAAKAGHTGTLDPLATGVLPVCLGAATKFSASQLRADKRYRAIVQLGRRTSTGDAEGETLEVQGVPELSEEALDQARRRFTGAIEQVPPMYSALKKDGRPLYRYARAGIEVERAARAVEILELDLQVLHEQTDAPALEITVRCSKGTYVRTLGEQLAAALGTVGHLRSLRRLAAGAFDETACVTLPELEAQDDEARLRHVLPPQVLLEGFDMVVLDEHDAGRFLCGLRRRGDWAESEQVAVYGSNPYAFLGSARVRAGELIPLRLLSPTEVEQSIVGVRAA